MIGVDRDAKRMVADTRADPGIHGLLVARTRTMLGLPSVERATAPRGAEGESARARESGREP